MAWFGVDRYIPSASQIAIGTFDLARTASPDMARLGWDRRGEVGSGRNWHGMEIELAGLG